MIRRKLVNHNTVRFFLSLGVLIIAAIMILGFFFIKVPQDNLRLLDTALGYVAGLVSGAFGFYFGASSDNSKKNKLEINDDDESTQP